MAAHSVDVVFHAHDHVAVVGEKLDREGRGEGVIYALGGQGAGGTHTPGWKRRGWFREHMDYDENGVADFLEGVTGSVGAGFYLVTVTGRERVDLAYVLSDPDPKVNADAAVVARGGKDASGAASIFAA